MKSPDGPSTDDKPPPKRPESRFRKILRVMGYAVVVCTAAGLVAASSAYGDMKDGALEIGAELGNLGDIGSKTPIVLNGQPIYVGSQVLDMSVSEALDRAETLCQGGSPERPGASTAPLDSAEAAFDTDGKKSMGLMREERDGRGVVMCFAPSEQAPPPDGIQDRMSRWLSFFATGDLDRLGKLRYMFARETDGGRTHLVRVWTDEPFNLYAFTSSTGGDAPGSDPQDMPRPPESRRLLSATVQTAVYATRVYESRLTPAQIAEAYDQQMPDQGWELALTAGEARIYKRHDVSVFVTPREHDGHSLVSLLHMGHDPSLAGPVAPTTP